MQSLAGNVINLLVLIFILLLIFRTLPKIVGIPVIIIILAVIFPNDRVVKTLSRMINRNLGLIIIVAIIWYGILHMAGRKSK